MIFFWQFEREEDHYENEFLDLQVAVEDVDLGKLQKLLDGVEASLTLKLDVISLDAPYNRDNDECFQKNKKVFSSATICLAEVKKTRFSYKKDKLSILLNRTSLEGLIENIN